VGGRKDPIWRVVVAGQYNPQTQPSTIKLDEERVRAWLAKGAQPSETVRKLLRTQGIDPNAR
jgi:small subunit ribosomal protein S16